MRAASTSRLSVDQAVEEIREGRQIILVDDEDRENEGDLCMAATKVTPEHITFMARYGRGLICLTLTGKRIEQLGLAPMTERNLSRFGTNFHVSIEARDGITTGISASDRARTIAAAVAPDARPEHLVSPGHIFPIRAVDGGVLVRCGQTEGSVDLARMAGLEPAGVICEIMNDDGSMARRADLESFAKAHGLGILTIAQLIESRLRTEPQVQVVADTQVVPDGVNSTFRLLLYSARSSSAQYVALVLGDIASDRPTLVRVHRASLINDVFGVVRGPGTSKNRRALHMIEQAGVGVFLYVLPESIDLLGQIRQFEQRKTFEGLPPAQGLPALREVGLGAQVLASLGLRKIRLMTDNPKRIAGLSGYGLEIVEQVPINC